ncbi:hypothetical protein SANT12839_080490 [Streptomyces antimycoticus]|uniref:Uncharacterized protein n=1 Tax=Streptomyces antimycoticus TaxID=68175 RepID=A0A4D4KL99_9ACTN|nr:hypothetical protein SANT12839_080490 [Streptomyces antimycoticus]
MLSPFMRASPPGPPGGGTGPGPLDLVAQQLPQLGLQRGEPGSAAHRPGARAVERRAAFGDHPAGPGRHHHHPVPEHDRLLQAVGDEQRGGTGRLAHREQLVLEDGAQLGVERGERFVQQQHLRLHGERAGDRHALPHPARQGGGVGVGEVGETEPGQPVPGPRVGGLAWYALHIEAEADVGQHGLPVVDPVVLRDHRGRMAPARAQLDLTAAGTDESGDDAQER